MHSDKKEYARALSPRGALSQKSEPRGPCGGTERRKEGGRAAAAEDRRERGLRRAATRSAGPCGTVGVFPYPGGDKTQLDAGQRRGPTSGASC